MRDSVFEENDKPERWYSEIFRSFRDAQSHAINLLTTSTVLLNRGVGEIEVVRAKADLAQVLEADWGIASPDESYELQYKRASVVAETSFREVKSGFQFLQQHFVIVYWALLDNFIKSVVAGVLRYELAELPKDVQDIRVRIGEMLEMDEESRWYYIVDQLDQLGPSRTKIGGERYERLLETVGLSGGLKPEWNSQIETFQALRHVFVHRRGVADARFVRTCPNLEWRVGQEIRLELHRTLGQALGCLQYATAIRRRVVDSSNLKNREAT